MAYLGNGLTITGDTINVSAPGDGLNYPTGANDKWCCMLCSTASHS